MHFTRVKFKTIETSFKHVMNERFSHSENTEIAQNHKIDDKNQITTNSRQDTTNVDIFSIKFSIIIDVKAIIAEMCEIVKTTLSFENELNDLNINFFIIFELESRIQKTIKIEIINEKLNACVTIKNIEILMFFKIK